MGEGDNVLELSGGWVVIRLGAVRSGGASCAESEASVQRLKWILLSAALVLGATCVHAQPQSGRPVNDIVLHMWHIPSKGSYTVDPISTGRRRVVEEFLRKNPKISLWSLIPLRIQGPASEGREFLAVAGGVAPDVFYLSGRQIAQYRRQGFLYSLNEYIEDYARRHGRPYTGINSPDNVWEQCIDRGRILCVPISYYSTALMCNRQMLAKAGFGERGPRTWEELYLYARRMTRDPSKEPDADPHDPLQFGLELLTGLEAGGQFQQYVWSAGGEVARSYYEREDGTLVEVGAPPTDYAALGIKLSNGPAYERERAGKIAGLVSDGVPTEYSVNDLKWRLATDSPAAREALAFYRRLVHQPWLRNGDHEFDITPEMMRSRKAEDPETGEVFDLDDEEIARRVYYGVADAAAKQAGERRLVRVQYAMRLGVIDEADITDRATEFPFPFPSREGAPPAALMQARYLAINATIAPSSESGRSSVKKIRQAAWDYIEYCTSPRAQQVRVETFVEFGFEEYVRPSLLVDAGYEHLLERIPEERRRLWENLTAAARVEPYCDGYHHVKTRELSHPIEVLVNDAPDPATGAFSRDLGAVMDATVERVNSVILGEMPEEELRRRARVGWVIFVVMAAGLVGGGFLIVRLALAAQAKWRDSEGFGVGGQPAKRRLYAWVILLPAVVSILIWRYYPLAKGMVMAFQDYRIVGDSTYVGLRNFIEVASERSFWIYLLQTCEYMMLAIGIGFCAPIFLALLLTEIPKGKVLFRVIYYLPAVTTGLVTLFLWKNLLYDPTSNGVLNRFVLWFNRLPAGMAGSLKALVLIGTVGAVVGLVGQALSRINTGKQRAASGVAAGLLGAAVVWFFASRLAAGGMAGVISVFVSRFDFEVQKFLRDPRLAMLWCVVPGIWAGAGPGCLIYLAALKGIPETQYEAADIDGAGVWKKFWNVTFPNLHALIIINFVGAVIGAFHASGNIFVMTGGGPENKTMTIGLEIWYNAFLYLKFGTATAMAWIMGALLIGFTLNQLRILNKLQFRSAAVEEVAAGGRA